MLSRARRRTLQEWALAGEAFVLLAAFRLALRVIPVRRIVRFLTHRRARRSTSASQPNERARAEALRVRWAVLAATRNSPAQFVCFPQSLAAYVMLRRRHVASTIVYGVARSSAGELLAHTWLLVGDRTVVGGEGADAFSPIERWS